MICRRLPLFIVATFCQVVVNATTASCQDWPTFAHDEHRSAATAETLALPLSPAWVHRADHAPSPAWPPPARQDYWHYKDNLHPRVSFDHAYHVAVVDERVYYGSSTNDSIICLDAESGAVVWTFTAEGPVRLAPTVADNKVWAGSDDGCVYCLSPEDGQLIWQQRIGPAADRCIGNGRVISRWPVRSGVLVRDGIAYCAAGLFPTSEGVLLAGLDCETGAAVLRRNIEQPAQGYVALTEDQVIVPSGRASPLTYRRSDGQLVGEIASEGGTYTVVSSDLLVAGQGDTDGELSLARADTRESILSLRGLHLIAWENNLYVHGRDELAALDRGRFMPLAHRHAVVTQRYDQLQKGKRKDAQAKEETAQLKEELDSLNRAMQSCWLWKSPCQHSESLVLAGDTLFAGGDQAVVAYDAASGREVWTGSVDGRACGLAVARGRLLVSTDKGLICCFASGAPLPQAAATVTDRTEPSANNATASEPPSALAREILDSLPTDLGFGLVVGDRGGRLAAELAQNSRLHVIIVQRDRDVIDTTRADLRRRGLLGTRVVVHEGTNDQLASYPAFFANLMVLAGPGSKDAVRRLLRPEGGVAWVAANSDVSSSHQPELPADSFSVEQRQVGQRHWRLVRRGSLPGSGQWTHGYADPGNTACTQDRFVQGPLRIQWFGRPGPREMADRHHRNVAPLAKSGRLFVPGENLVIAVDAYNGTQLWQREIPRSLRLGAFLDCSNMVVDDQSLYVVAEDTCQALNVKSGSTRKSIQLPQLVPDQPHHWGYVARVDKWLIGSGRKPQAAYQRQSRNDDLALWYDSMALVSSDYLFALPVDGNETTWTYRSGIIINPTIAIGGGRVYFLESQAPQALRNSQGRMPMSTFSDGECFLVALDLPTGKTLWKRPFDLTNYQHIAYVNYADEKLVVSGNRYVNRTLWYFFQGLDAQSGQDVWSASHDSHYERGGDHGEQNRHPTIVGNAVYTYPLAYDLHTGRQLEGWQFDRMGHGCGNVSASAGCIFWRGDNPWQRDLQTGKTATRINSVNRPGCFINMIPAGGLLLVPEASSGCTCGFPLQTSLAYIPASLAQ